MRDIRNFTKAKHGKSSNITEGTVIGELATDMPSVGETLPLDESSVPTNVTVDDNATIEKLAAAAKASSNNSNKEGGEGIPLDEETDRIDLFYNFIKEKGVTDDVIRNIQKSILQGEAINFETTILKNMDLVLTTRPAWVNELIIEELNKYSNVSYQMYIDIVSRVNLAASLVVFAGHRFEPLTQENYKDRVEKLRELPSFVYDKIVNELVIFDRLIAVATSDKYLETFI